MISLGVTTPGRMGSCFAMQAAITPSSLPGDTMNCAPAAAACASCSREITVPAPTSISGTSFTTAAMLALAAAVRKVISITSTPPASRALAVGTARATSSSTITGTTPQRATLSIAVI